MDSLTIRINDMDCPQEAAVLTSALLPLVGEDSRLRFDYLQRTLRVDLRGLTATSGQILKAVASTGMKGEPLGPAVSGPPSGPIPSCACCGGSCSATGSFWERRGREVLCAASGLFWMAGLAIMIHGHGSLLAAFRESASAPLAAKTLWILAACAGVWHVLPKAAGSLRAMRPDMNLLMFLAVAGAMSIGEYSEGASVAFLFALANQIESWSVGRARDAIQSLMGLAPDTAMLLRGPDGPPGLPMTTPVDAVVTGSLILVRPGDRVPLDGTVRSGMSAVDQSPITGESMPVPKEPGDHVYAGTINTEGALEVETTAPASQSTLARIMRLVEEAQSRRARAVQWVEKFAAVYTPAMVGVSLLFAVVPPLVTGGEWARWFYEALVILVISCPCALVISTPVSIVAGMACAARNGVLIKGGVYLEAPATINAVAFDKTGTLTHGRPSVTRTTPLDGVSESRLLGVAAALESRSGHPVAQAVLRHAASSGAAAPEVEDAQSRPGLGALGVIGGEAHFIGNLRFLDETAAGPRSSQFVQELARHQEACGTVVAVWTRDRILGLITVEDRVRPQSRQVLEELKAEGVDTIVMLTGDNAATAARIAGEAGVTGFRADLMPEDKTRVVEELRAAGKRVAMVGDGVNDAPALAASHLGVAMGSIGADAAIETADVALMSDDLAKLPWLIRHSRRVMGVIKANIGIALGIKAVFLVLATLQMATLWTAILADLGTSLFVIFNGLRLLRRRP